MEENFEDLNGFTIDASEIREQETPKIPVKKEPAKKGRVKVVAREHSEEDLVNCLTDKDVEVRFINKTGDITDPKHPLYGGLADGAFITISVPKLRSGTFVNVLTDAEKDYLEYIMGLEAGALNVYNKTDNFWDNNTEGGISSVRLSKYKTVLHLKDPKDYIRYKILLANKDIVAPSLQALQDKPKATYRYVLVADDDINSLTKMKMSINRQCYVEYGKVEDNARILRMIIEIITGKPLATNTKLDFLQSKAGELIEADAKMFLSVIKDPLLSVKVLIADCVEAGIISKRGTYYYLREDNTPLCENGEEPVLSVAAKYLSVPKRQELKFSLQAKLNAK